MTYSGATTAHLLSDRQNGAPPQIDALDGPGGDLLVTITIGGNDVGYVPLLMAASLPGVLRRVPALRALLEPAARDAALAGVGAKLRAIGEAVRARAPQATVCFVDSSRLVCRAVDRRPAGSPGRAGPRRCIPPRRACVRSPTLWFRPSGQVDELAHGVQVAAGALHAQRLGDGFGIQVGPACAVAIADVQILADHLHIRIGELGGLKALTALAVGFPVRKYTYE